MKKFLIFIATALCIIIAFNFLFVILIGGRLRTYESKFWGVEDNWSQTKAIVLGDSHANNAWSSNTNKAIFNFAAGSDNITDLTSKFDYIAHDHNDLSDKTFIITFDPHNIATYRETKHNNALNQIINSPYLNSNLIYYFPLIFSDNLQLDFEQYIKRLYKKQKAAGRKYVLADSAVFTKRYKEQYYKSQQSLVLINKYQKLIDSIRAHHGKVAGIKYPLHPLYKSIVKNDTAFLRLNKSMDSLAERNHIAIIDFGNYITNPKYFADQDHLNLDGSAALTNIVKQVAPNWIYNQNKK